MNSLYLLMNSTQIPSPTCLLPLHGGILSSFIPLKGCCIFPPVVLDISRPKPIQNNPPKLKKREGDVEKWEWGINWQRFLQVLQMQCITICLWNVSYFQSVFNSFPNMTHCSSQARGSDVEALRREARLWSAARKWHPRACAERRKTFTLLRCSLEQTLLGLKLLVASYRVITRCMCLSVRCLKVVANINKHLWGCPAWSVDSA